MTFNLTKNQQRIDLSDSIFDFFSDFWGFILGNYPKRLSVELADKINVHFPEKLLGGCETAAPSWRMSVKPYLCKKLTQHIYTHILLSEKCNGIKNVDFGFLTQINLWYLLDFQYNFVSRNILYQKYLLYTYIQSFIDSLETISNRDEKKLLTDKNRRNDPF